MKRYAIIILVLLAFSILFVSPLIGKDFDNIVQVKVKGITIDSSTSKPIVILQDLEQRKILPIWIGSFEANAIALGIEHIVPPRPMTHDLIKNILEGIKAKVRKIIITDLKNNVFYSVVLLDINNVEVSVDSRPSDAIALALKVDAPIFVSKDIMARAKVFNGKPKKSLRNILLPYGLTFQELTPAIAQHFNLTNPKGVLISDVSSGSAAELAGIKRGDVIRKISREDVLTLNDINRIISKGNINDFILINIERERIFYTFKLKSKNKEIVK